MSIKIGLALGGGGARGLAHIGVLKVLEREHVPIYQITGCSIGAIIGGAYAFLRNARATEKFIRDLLGSPAFNNLDIQIFSDADHDRATRNLDYYLNNLKKYFSLLKTLNKISVYDEKQIKDIFEMYPETAIEELPLRFASIATDLISGREIVINEGSLRTAVIASASIPGIFPPVKMERQLLIDGGATDSIPVQIVRGQGAQYVIAVDVSKCINDIGTLETGLQVIYRAEDIVSHHLTQERIAGVDYLIRPEVGHYSWADVGKMDEIIAAGEQAAQKAIPDIKRMLGCK